jgi:DNA-binding MarR family transcriptional regulator
MGERGGAVGAGRALGMAMQRLFFSVKRVHWRWQQRARRVLREVDVPLTPARFTLMRVLYTYRHGIARFNLVKLLGVAGPVVSRMLKALEGLGLTERIRGVTRDARVVLVRATTAGRAMVGAALEATNRETERIATVCFASSQHPEVDLDVLDRFLLRARVKLVDPTPFPVPWRGGDLWSIAEGFFRLEQPAPFEVHVAA